MKTKLEKLKTKREMLDKEIALAEQEEKEKFTLTKELIKIPELNIEVEKKLHTKMDNVYKIVIPEGFRLLELSELIFIYNNYQDKFNWGKDKFFDEITKQPIKDCNYPYHNAWLRRLDVVSGSVMATTGVFTTAMPCVGCVL